MRRARPRGRARRRPRRAEREQRPDASTTFRRPAARRAMPSSSRSSSSGSMRTFESEPMQIPIPRSQSAATGAKPSPRFASVVGHTQTRAPASASRSSSHRVGVRRVDDGRARAEAAGAVEQLDRPDAVLGEALLDLARLLVGVDVQRQPLGSARSGRSPRASRPGRRARSGGRRRRAAPALAQRLDLAEVLGRRLLAEAREPAAPVRGEEQDERRCRPPRPPPRRQRLVERRGSGTRPTAV